MTTGTYSFVSLIVKTILLELAPSSLSVLAVPGADKTKCFVHLSFNSTLHLVTGSSSDLQEVLRYFNGMAMVALFITLLA